MFFIDASTAETIAAGLRNIAIVKGAGDSEQDALDLLARQRKEWLLFFDSADDITLNLREYFPGCSHGNILITSRNRETRHHALSQRSNCKISGLAAEEAKDLLLEIAGLGDKLTTEVESLAMTIVKVCNFAFLGLSVR